MPYYMAGDYYKAGDGNYAAGGIFSFIGKAAKAVGKVVGGVARTALAATPVGAGINALIPAQTTMQGRPLEPVPGIRGAAQRLVPGGESGYRLAKSRRMNAGNAKAARRAIRRIKSVRHLLKSIERELPMRPAPRSGSRGVITRAEAARALRS